MSTYVIRDSSEEAETVQINEFAPSNEHGEYMYKVRRTDGSYVVVGEMGLRRSPLGKASQFQVLRGCVLYGDTGLESLYVIHLHLPDIDHGPIRHFTYKVEVLPEDKDANKGDNTKISCVGLFRSLNVIAEVEDVYEILCNPFSDEHLESSHSHTPPSVVDIVLNIKEAEISEGRTHRFMIAILLKHQQPHAEGGFPALTITANSLYRWGTRTATPKLRARNTFDCLSFKTENSHTLFSWAAANGWQELLQQGKENGLYNNGDKSGRTPLSWAAGNGQVEATKLILEDPNVSVNAKDHKERTALSWAAGNGCKETMNSLLYGAHDVDPNIVDGNHRSPLLWAVENGHTGVVESLLSPFFYPHPIANRSHVAIAIDTADRAGETPLSVAAKKDHCEIMHFLVKAEFRGPARPVSHCERLGTTWATKYLHKAAKNGWLNLVQILVQEGGLVEIDGLDDQQRRTALCSAAEKGGAHIVDALLTAGANRDFQTLDDKDTPLTIAVRQGNTEVVKTLLNAGADIYRVNAMGKSPMVLAEDGDHGTILQMLAQRNKDGPLAETLDEKNERVDKQFTATVVDINYTSQHVIKEVSVHELLATQDLPPNSFNASLAIRWIHLPANNMRWVEVLVAKVYNSPTKACRLFNADRWIRRQHRGINGIPHATFMQPICQTFQNNSADRAPPISARRQPSECLVLFMPYLHWDTMEDQTNRQEVIHQHLEKSPSDVSGYTKDQALLRAYLGDTHPIHVRRTLDQYYYHSMKNTEARDKDQVVTRYQSAHGLTHKVITMVDQLWLWVISGDHSRPETVITCFPCRERVSGESQHCDFTDVLENIKLSLLDEISHVSTAFDLASIIASKCSNAYMSIAAIKEAPGFAEMYELAISDVMRRESELFARFSLLTKVPQYETKLADEIATIVENQYTHLNKTRTYLHSLCVLRLQGAVYDNRFRG